MRLKWLAAGALPPYKRNAPSHPLLPPTHRRSRGGGHPLPASSGRHVCVGGPAVSVPGCGHFGAGVRWEMGCAACRSASAAATAAAAAAGY